MWIVPTLQDQKETRKPPLLPSPPSLKAIQTADECRIVSLNNHLARNKDRNQSLLIVCQSEENESKSGK